jgi:hypothetical protein
LIVGNAIDVSGDYLVTFGDLLLDADVEIGRSGYLFNYRSLVVLCATLFPCKRVMNYEVGSQEFIHSGRPRCPYSRPPRGIYAPGLYYSLRPTEASSSVRQLAFLYQADTVHDASQSDPAHRRRLTHRTPWKVASAKDS